MSDEQSKRCLRCGITKPVGDFWPDKTSPDGWRASCADCMNAARRGTRRTNPEWDRRYRERHPERYRSLKRAWMARNPEATTAQHTLRNAVARGRIERPTRCQECGREGLIHGHHDDYSKPLDVMWLCPPCHMGIHKLARAALGEDT